MTTKKRNKRLKKQGEKSIGKNTEIQKIESAPVVGKKAEQPTAHRFSESMHTATQKIRTQYTTLNKEGNVDKIWSSLGVLLVLGLTLWLVYGYIPQVYKLTSLGGVEELDKKAADRAEERKKEDQRIAGVNQVVMKTNFGDLKLNLFTSQVPVTADNFLRLAERGKYNNVFFHRIVKESTFAVLQGGDYNQGKKDANGNLVTSDAALQATINDEQWKVEPEINGQNALTNQPEFTVPEAYKDFAVIAQGQTQVTIKKGYVAMAKTQQPNSAGAQFFFILSDTTLPADYTVFAKVSNETLAVLDTIYQQVDPVDADGKVTQDGKPSKEIKIETVNLVR